MGVSMDITYGHPGTVRSVWGVAEASFGRIFKCCACRACAGYVCNVKTLVRGRWLAAVGMHQQVSTVCLQ